MHCFTGLLLLLLCASSLSAQINKGRKLLETANYEAALEAFENDIEKETSKPVSLYEIAQIYENEKYSNYNLDKAYLFINRAIKEFEGLSSANKRKVQNKGVNLPELKKLQQDIVRKALQFSQKENTITSLQHFVDYYTSANKQQQEQAYQQRNILIVKEAKKLHTFAQYQTVWEDYKKNMIRYNPNLIKEIEKLLLESYISEQGWAMYPRFEELYPENVYVLSKDAAYDYLKIRKSKQLKDFQEFMEAYPKTPFTKYAKDNILALTMEGEDLANYDAFIRAYPDHEQIEQLWKRFYELYAPDKKKESIQAFATAYPNFPFQKIIQQDLIAAQERLEQPIFLEVSQQKDIVAAMNFVQQFPTSSYIPKMEQVFYEALQKKPLLRGAKYFLTHFPNSSHYDAVLELYYKEYVKDGELGTLNQFMMEHPEYKNLAQLEKDLKVAEQGAQLDLSLMPTNATKPLYEAYILAAAPKERAFVALQRLLEPSIRLKKWQKAQQIIAQFEEAFAATPTKIQQLKGLLVAAPSYAKTLPNSINSLATEQVVDWQNGQLLFAREGAIYQSSKEEGQWTVPILLPIINEGIQGESWTINTSSNELVYSKKGKLYYRNLKEGQWSTPVALTATTEQEGKQLEAHWSPDGKALVYSYEGSQVLDWKTSVVAQNFHGSEQANSDLFVVLRDEKGQWQQPINLGDHINTPFAERHPYLHPDGKTLYFSSEGHGGLGGLDIYYTRRLDDTWQHWSIPVNVGTAVNSVENEGPCAVSPDFNQLYFTRQNEEGRKIYHHSNTPSK